MSDLDVLVAAASFPAASQVLRKSGYHPAFAHSRKQEEARLRSDCECEFFNAEGNVMLDLHWQITAPHLAQRFRFEDLWNRRRTVTIGQKPVSTFSAEDTTLVLAVHGGKHLWQRLSWLADFAESLRQDLNWQMLKSRACAAGAERMLWLALALAQDLLQVEFPPEFAGAVSNDAGVQSIASEIARTLFENKNGAEESEVRWLTLLRLADSRWKGVSSAARFACGSGPREWEAVRLPDSLFAFYPLVRIVTLLRRAPSFLFAGGPRQPGLTRYAADLRREPLCSRIPKKLKALYLPTCVQSLACRMRSSMIRKLISLPRGATAWFLMLCPLAVTLTAMSPTTRAATSEPYVTCNLAENGATDDGPAINACLAAHPGRHIMLRKTGGASYGGGQATSKDIYSSQTITMVGDAQWLDCDAPALWAGGCRIDFDPALKGPGIAVSPKASGVQISNLEVYGGNCWSPTDLTTYSLPPRINGMGNDGILLAGGEPKLVNVQANCFKRHGISVLGDSSAYDPKTFGYSQPDFVRFDRVGVGNNKAYGVFITGADSNAGLITFIDARANQLGGIYDHSQLGNTWIAPGFHSNTRSPDTAGRHKRSRRSVWRATWPRSWSRKHWEKPWRRRETGSASPVPLTRPSTLHAK